MAEYRHSLTKILARHVDGPYDPEHRELIKYVAAALYERHKQFPQWPESVRLFYACNDINFQVLNGGFAQAAYNVPELLPIARTAIMSVGILPPHAFTDAAHVAVSAVHAIDYLLTWNCKHLANAQIARRIASACESEGYTIPAICTPEELMGG